MLTESLRPGTMPGNLWLGISVVNQEEADRDIPRLLQVPAHIRFLSLEPLLGPVHVSRWLVPWSHSEDCYGRRVDWLIVGGESGPHARPFDIAWARSIRDQCDDAGVPVFVKQLGSHVLWNGMSGPDEHWPRSTGSIDTGHGHFRKHLSDFRHGADMDEWPPDLRVQEHPHP
jgi:protein gp37